MALGGRADWGGAGCPRRCHRGRPKLPTSSPSRLRVALVPPRGKEDAHLLPQSDCGPRHCADSGSGGCPSRARATGARPAAPGSSLSGKCRKRSLNSTTSQPPAPPPSHSPAAAAASHSHARTHRPAHSLPFTLTRPPPNPKPQRPKLLDRLPPQRREPPRPDAGRRTLGSPAAAAWDLGEPRAPPAWRGGGAAAPWAEAA